MPANRHVLEQVAQAVHHDAVKVEHLGTGGFASTFRVEQADGAVVALKVIDPTIAEVERVDRELAALRRVHHPNVVRYRDFGSFGFRGDDYRWIEMDYIEGQSLMQLLRGGRRFTVRDAVSLLRGAVAGASAIWAAGTAHRDLSPNNLLGTADDHVVIVDLGLARHVDDTTITVLPTPGTPGWMSPEQVGTSPTHGDWRSDQFVLGLLGYLLLTGVGPYTARHAIELWQAPALQTPRPVRAVNPDIPSAVSDVIDRMLSQRPHRRYLQSAALLEDIDRALAALNVETTAPERTSGFYLIIGQLKSFATSAFLSDLGAAGLIIDARARARVNEFCTAATAAAAIAVIDPVTYLARSPLAVRPAAYQNLIRGGDPTLTGFADDAARRAWSRPVMEASLSERPDVVIAPYFYAGSGELTWIQESLACARVASELVSELSGPTIESAPPQVWAAVAVESSWLLNDADRDRLLTALTGQTSDALYLLVHTTQPSFGPLADTATLRGFRDLLEVMREAGTPVIVGRRASSGLLLLALGAAGWSTGTSANLMNMAPHPQEEASGGPSYDRVYVPKLLNQITAPIYSLMYKADPVLVELPTDQGRALLSDNPDLDGLTTEQRQLLNQHNLISMAQQARELGSRAASQRVALIREWIDDAQNAYRALPPTRQAGEDSAFLDAWLEII